MKSPQEMTFADLKRIYGETILMVTFIISQVARVEGKVNTALGYEYIGVGIQGSFDHRTTIKEHIAPRCKNVYSSVKVVV